VLSVLVLGATQTITLRHTLRYGQIQWCVAIMPLTSTDQADDN
jgi:hypothetical protein